MLADDFRQGPVEHREMRPSDPLQQVADAERLQAVDRAHPEIDARGLGKIPRLDRDLGHAESCMPPARSSGNRKRNRRN